MKMFDQHVHSSYSHDSIASLEKYIKKAIKLGLSHFVVTDHADFDYRCTGKDNIFDYKKEKKTLEKLQCKYPNIKILQGAEIGYKKNSMDKIKKLIKEGHFDVVNFSLHDNEYDDYYFPQAFEKDGINVSLDKYFDLYIEMLLSFDDFDVCSHVDYAIKTAKKIEPNVRLQDYEDKLINALKIIVAKDKCLEINVRVQDGLGEESTKYLLGKYKELGGVNITLSSDSHTVKDYRKHFDYYIPLIKNAGFDHLNYFIKRKRYNLDI